MQSLSRQSPSTVHRQTESYKSKGSNMAYATASLVPVTPPTENSRTDVESNSSKYTPHVLHTARIHIVFGLLLAIFGAVAAGLKAYYSYMAIPILTGLGVFCVTGVIGVRATSKKSKHLSNSYIGMSAVSLAIGLGMITLYAFAVANDTHGSGYFCYPVTYPSMTRDCPTSQASRVAIDALIAVTSLLESVLSIVSIVYSSVSAGCCSKACCNRCCCPLRQTGQQTQPTIVYLNQAMDIQAIPNGAFQNRAMVNQGDSQPVIFVVQQPPSNQLPQQHVAATPPAQTQLQQQ